MERVKGIESSSWLGDLPRRKKGRLMFVRRPVVKNRMLAGYFFPFFGAAAFVAFRRSSMAAWAAARRATGTRNGEQLT